MRVLIACEFSGIVRDAFAARGHDAWSCDLLPSERGGKHLHGVDVRDVLGDRWDLMVAHPPCTYLANSGSRWLYGGKGRIRNDERWALMEDACRFFKELLNAPVPRIAVENPIMHGHARRLIGVEPSQIVHPWMFGDGESKATCLWLRSLPKLHMSNPVAGRKGRVHQESPGPDRWKRRSRTYPGFANAMAEQWT